MKTIFGLLALIILSACTSTQSTPVTSAPPPPVNVEVGAVIAPAPAADPVVVNAEKTLAVARDTFKFIARQERQNRATFDKVSPKIHDFVEYIRRNGVGWLRTAEAMKTAYKQNRTPENRANLITAVSTVSEALNQSKEYLKQAGFGATP